MVAWLGNEWMVNELYFGALLQASASAAYDSAATVESASPSVLSMMTSMDRGVLSSTTVSLCVSGFPGMAHPCKVLEVTLSFSTETRKIYHRGAQVVDNKSAHGESR